MNNNLLQSARQHFTLDDVKQPNLYREQFPYSETPRILFDGRMVAPMTPEQLWITDTTFRDGQQARPPYTPEQIIHLFDLLHKLGGSNGVVRQCEFFLYSKRDRRALEGCFARGYAFPEITGWIRAHKADFSLVKEFKLKETGILTSVSDYHIFLKLKKTRAKILEDYLDIVRTALNEGIVPRCHFEDVTRADIYGFCLPFAAELLKLSQESGIPVKIRLCDTLGYGISYPGAVLPRSIPKLVHAFRHDVGYPAELLEWHGHNDFHKVHINGATAWLYGISALNASLLGFGERTGNPPLESAVIEYMGLTGTANGMDTKVITEIADYFRKEIKADIPNNYPFVGADFNTTRAGIHADGLLKDEEIYNIFDTTKLLDRPLKVTVTDKSGVAGIARWLNENIADIKASRRETINKRHPGIKEIYNWVMEQYAQGRTTSISPEELMAQARHYLPSLFMSEFRQVKAAAMRIAQHMAEKISAIPEIKRLAKDRMEEVLNDLLKKEHSIQLAAITNTDGYRISQVHTQRGEKGLFRRLLNKNFKQHNWFIGVLEQGKPYYSDLFFSEFTKELIMTAALPIFDADRNIIAILDLDFKFEELDKMISDIPDEILETPYKIAGWGVDYD